MEETRNLKFTHKEIELIQRALGIAEKKLADARKDYIENLINVRGVYSNSKVISEETDFMFDKQNEFCDLLLSIINGEKDC
jgi:hypothetical protein